MSNHLEKCLYKATKSWLIIWDYSNRVLWKQTSPNSKGRLKFTTNILSNILVSIDDDDYDEMF